MATNVGGDTGASVSVTCRQRKKIMRQALEYCSKCKYVKVSGWDGASAPHHGRGQQERTPCDGSGQRERSRFQLKQTNKVNKHRDMHLKKIEIKRTNAVKFGSKGIESPSRIDIDTAEFRSKSPKYQHAAELRSKRQKSQSRIDAAELRSKRRKSPLRIDSSELRSKRPKFLARIDATKLRNKRSQSLSRIEGIDAAEFRSKRSNSPSRIERIDVAEFRGKRSKSPSRIEGDATEFRSKRIKSPSRIEGIDAVEFRGKRTKSISRTESISDEFKTKKKSSTSKKGVDHYRCISPADANLCSHEGYFIQTGFDCEDVNCEGIERIDKAEFMKSKKRLKANMGPSSKGELNDGKSAATCRKGIGNVSKKVLSSDFDNSFPLKDACHGSDQVQRNNSSSFVQTGGDDEDTVPEEIGIEKIDEANFRNQKTQFMPKIGLSTAKGLTESCFVASSGKNVHGTCNNILSADLHTLFSAKDCCADQLLDKSSPSGNEGIDNWRSPSKKIESEKIDAAELNASKTWPLSMQGVDDITKEKIFIDCRTSSFTVDTMRDSDESTSSAEKDSKSGRGHIHETKECGEEDKQVHEPRPQIHHALPLKFRFEDEVPKDKEKLEYENKVESLFAKLDFYWSAEEVESFKCLVVDKENVPVEETPQEKCARGKHELISEDDEGLFCIYCHYVELGPKDVLPPWVEIICFDSDEKKTSEPSYMTRKGNNNEEADIERVEIERIDKSKSVFKNNRMEVAATSGEKNNMSKMMPSTEMIDVMRKKRGRKRKNVDLIGDSSDVVNNGSVKCMISESGKHTNRENVGIASRTRSKMGTNKQPSTVNIIALDLEDDSDSSTDIKFCSSDDEEFKVDHLVQTNNEKTEMGTYGNEPDGQNNTLIEDSEQRRIFSQREMHPHNVASNKQIKHRKLCKTSVADDKKESSSKILSHDANAEDGLKQKSGAKRCKVNEEDGLKQKSGAKRCKVNEGNESISKILHDANHEGKQYGGKKDNKQTFKHLKHLKPQLSSDGVDEVHLPQARLTHQKKLVSPSPSNEDFDQRDYDRSNGHYDGNYVNKNEGVHVLHEIKRQSKGARVFSKQYDLYKILGDSVLERDQIFEMKECDVEDSRDHEPQFHNPLPKKFSFEDEVPKEEEKSEYEKKMDQWFAELEFNWALVELGSFTCPEVDQEKDPAEETPHERCAKGKHELIIEDDQGLFCIYCHHVVLGPRDVFPEWAEKIHYESGRKRQSETEEPIDLVQLFLDSSMDSDVDLSNSATSTVWSFKPGIQESMYEHQREGFEFLWKNLAGSINIAELKSSNPCGVGGCIISHAPGTGKTRLTIVFIETYLKMFPNCRPVIIAPAAMLLTWEEEFRKWNVEFPFHNLNNLDFLGKENKTALNLLHGVKRQSKEMIRMVKIFSWNIGKSILGISYSLFEKLTGQKYKNEKMDKTGRRTIIDNRMEVLRTILLEKPGLVVLDEGHTPRNQRSNIWNVLLKLKTEKRVILSGTPFQNNFAELFNTLRIVRPAIANTLAQEKTFAEMITSRRMSSKNHCMGVNSQSASISETIDRAVEKLKFSMSPFLHVHKGTILQQSLPGLRDCVVVLKPPALQRSLIERLEGLPSTFKFEHEVALISVHPYLFQRCNSSEEQRKGIDMKAVKTSKLNPNEGVKTKFIVEFVHLSMMLNEKVLIFSQYIQPLELIKEQLIEVFKWIEGRHILKLQGKLEQKYRQNLINAFNDPQSEAKIMLASTKCCSEGISLIGASRVILLDVVWNPSVERQAISRAYRIGQKKFVHTYHLMTSGTTEADKYCRQAEKMRLSELVFSSSSNESNIQMNDMSSIEDRILEEMVAHEKLKEMFDKIIHQPKDTNLVETFGLTG